MQQTDAIVTWHGAKWREAEPPVVVIPRTTEAGLITDRILAAMGDRAMTQSQVRDLVHARVEYVREALHRLEKRGVVVLETGRKGQTLYRVVR